MPRSAVHTGYKLNADPGGYDFLPILNFSFAEITFGDQHV